MIVPHPKRQGFALISVLVALAILLALLVPFMASVFNEGQISNKVVHKEKAGVEVDGFRDLLLHLAGNGHPAEEISAEEGSPDWDSRNEFPSRIPYPEAFQKELPRVLRSASVEDLQRQIHLPTATPLVLGNLLGLATTLLGDHDKDAEQIVVTDAERFPEEGGALFIYGERINYERREGNTFLGISRTIGQPQTLPEDSLVLDYRVVLAVTYQCRERTGGKSYVPYSSVAEVQSIGEVAGSPGRFTKAEMDVLQAHCTTYGMNDHAAQWGRKVRVFNDRDTTQVGPFWSLQTKTAIGFGGGTIVRISSLEDPDHAEYNFVWGTARPTRPSGEINLQSRWRLNLLFAPTSKFDHIATVVEPLVPIAVNINTAGRDVLKSILRGVRKGRIRTHDGATGEGKAPYGKMITTKDAEEMADQLVTMRAGLDQDAEGQPFRGFEDLTKRFFYMHGKLAQEAGDRKALQMLTVLMENMLYGRGPQADMATMPVCFTSSSLVKYRAGALRTNLAGLETARAEIRGVASVMPEHGLDFLSIRQRDWLENIRLNRRSPRWTTFPIALGALDPFVLGTDPGVIYPGLLFAEFYPKAGFGHPRYPSNDRGSIRASTVISRPVIGRKAGQARLRWDHETFRFATSPDGRHLAKEGVFDLINVGPRAQGGGGRRPRHPDASFRFTTDNEGMPGRHAVTFWFKLDSLGDVCLYDLSAEHFDRNRINCRFEAEHLVFEVLDEAGLDPEPSQTQTQPDRTAGTWRVPTQEMNLQANVWYHVSLSADGNRPDQMALFVDGVPRSEPDFQTELTEAIPEYGRPTAEVRPQDDKDRYPTIAVKSTEGFPARGVLRIGRELFEYTERDDTHFYCRPNDSMGERKARMSWREYRESLEQHLDENGRPTINAEDLQGTPTEDKTPEIPAGASVELYGYAAALYRDRPLTLSATKLKDQMGAWSVARAMIDNPVDIRLPGSQRRFSPGLGLEPTTTEDIYLLNPLPDIEGKGKPDKNSGDEAILAGFPSSGGYALLVQQRRRWEGASNAVAQAPTPIFTGGVELIRYSSREGSKLTGITRGEVIQGTEKFLANSSWLYDNKQGEGRYFVSEWDERIRARIAGEDVKFAELQQMVLYVVPISLPVNNAEALNNPSETLTVEWAQIYPGENNEFDTEWVRYNWITKEGEMVRIHHNAWSALYSTLARGQGGAMRLTPGGGGPTDPTVTSRLEYQLPSDDGQKRIGYIDPIELNSDYGGIIHHARHRFRFRGDPTTGTSSHAFNSGGEVMPCHRLELDWGKLGAMSARCGRNDRVALVGGTKASGSDRPSLEWHTLNWKFQRHGSDNYNQEPRQDGVEPERWGPFFFQMVAFKAGVQNTFVGPAERQDFLDTRRVDRIVKFPSGELPAAYVEAGYFGGPNPKVGDYKNASGFIDEVSAVGKAAESTLLNVEITEEATEIPIRKHVKLYSYGTIGVRHDMLQSYPKDGGLIRIDNELIAYKSYADGVFTVAEGGRGLLGTEVKAHGDCARVHFVPQIPCAILAGGVGASSNEFTTQNLGSFPRFGGTFLMGRELVHYTWTRRDEVLEMPKWYDPDDEQPDGMGLLRGRYGTAPQDGPSGSPILWFPTRFWDRYHARSDDPELGYYQATRRETPVFFTGVRWTEENPEPSMLKVRAIVNIDRSGTFADDPEKVEGMFEFEQGSVDDKANKIGWQGSLFEIRFATEYRPGCFDPETFLANGWKQAVTIQDMIVTYQGKTQVLEEQPTVK